MGVFAELLADTRQEAIEKAGSRQGYFSGPGGARDPQRLMSGVFPIGRGEPPDLSTRNLLEIYETSPWVRAIAGRVATGIAETRWRLFAQIGPGGKAVRNKALQRSSLEPRRVGLAKLAEAKQLRELEDHPLLDALHNSNPMMTGFDAIKVSQLGLDLVGDAFLVKERNKLGTPIGFWPVPSHWVIGLPTPQLPVFYVSYNAWVGNIPDTEILWLHDPTAANPYGRGAGVARALGDELETDEYTAKHAKQLFFNRARPDFIVMLDQADQPEVKRFETYWNTRAQGFWRQYKPLFVNRKLEFHEFQQQSLENLTMVPLRTFERDAILQCWGFPPEALGIRENANRSTIDAADFFLQKHVIGPRREFWRRVLQVRLAHEYDDRLVVEYQSTVAEDKQYELEVRKAASWAWTADEWRALAGDRPLPNGAGNFHLIPLNSFTTQDPVDQSQRPAPHPAAALPAAGQEPEKPAAKESR